MKTPWFKTVSAVAIIAGIVILAVFGDDLSENAKLLIINQMITQLGVVIAVKKVENVQHDIRNGVVTEKVKDAITEMAEPVQSADGSTVAMIVTPGYTGPERRQKG